MGGREATANEEGKEAAPPSWKEPPPDAPLGLSSAPFFPSPERSPDGPFWRRRPTAEPGLPTPRAGAGPVLAERNWRRALRWRSGSAPPVGKRAEPPETGRAAPAPRRAYIPVG